MNEFAANTLKVFRHRAYALYFMGNIVSWVGNSMQFIANSWLALELTGQAYSVAIVLIAYSVPGIILSPLIGVYIDRFDKKWFAAAMDIFRALVLFAVPILWWLHMLQPWHLYAMSFLLAVGDVTFSPTISALIREVVPQDVLLSANSYNSVALQIGSVMGAAVAGILVAVFSPLIVMIVNALSFLFSAICIISMRSGILYSKTTGNEHFVHRFLQELRDGLRYILGQPTITIRYLIMLTISATLYTINVLISLFAKNVLHIGVQGFGAMETSFAIGSIVGNLLMPGLAQRGNREHLMTWGLWAMAFSLVLLAISHTLWFALLSYFLLGATFSIWALYFTSVQEIVASDYQGRVYATFNTFSSLISLGIFFIMGVLSGQVSIRWLYGLQAGLLFIAGILAWQFLYRKSTSQKLSPEKPDVLIKTE